MHLGLMYEVKVIPFVREHVAGALYIGNDNHATNVSQGTCWSGGCHEAVHGSQVNSHLRY